MNPSSLTAIALQRTTKKVRATLPPQKVKNRMEHLELLPLNEYNRILIAFSGGKDSLACLLYLLSIGVPASKIELWHHSIDGHDSPTVGEKANPLMDWNCTPDYCRAIAEHFNIPIYFSWKSGGFKKEMLRDQDPTAATYFETPRNGVKSSGGNSPKKGTRLKFPMPSADLKARWCSAYLKIDVMTTAIRNQPRFENTETLVITGERAEESAARAKYKVVEVHRSDARAGRKGRYVDQWRPVLKWSEAEVWKIIEEYRINPHPAYRLGWGRVSCMTCIFGSSKMWASVGAIAPEKLSAITEYEKQFDSTVKAPNKNGSRQNTTEIAMSSRPYPNMKQSDIDAALSTEWSEPIELEHWTLPAGAFGDSAGSI